MQISTTALYFILFFILGKSKTAHVDLENAGPNQDAYGMTNYGFQCFNRVYPKFVIFAAAKRYCDIIKSRSKLKFLGPKDTGLPLHTELEPESRLVKNSAGEMVRIDPGPDRLIIDTECNIKDIISDLDYEEDPPMGRVIACTVLKSIEDYASSSVSSSSSSRSSSPEQSPERPLLPKKPT
ncbi:hypothetical protein EPUL_004406, partial [Erysiphe pulchra]